VVIALSTSPLNLTPTESVYIHGLF
jgi:hypothetical protein